MKNTSVTIVARNFQGGATFDSFDQEKCEQGLIRPIKKLVDSLPEEVVNLVIVTCAEEGSKFAEEVRDDITPTLMMVKRHFPEDVASGKIVLHMCTDWGLNAGSGNALNDGIEIARQSGSNKVLFWSPEIDLTGHMVYHMIYTMDEENLNLIGYFRNRWYQRIQWTYAQNTCVLWDLELLDSIGGFNPLCNGDGKTTVKTLEFGEVPLAGMEDIEAYFRACKQAGKFLRWGSIGKRQPVKWNLALKKPGTPEYENNLKKIARQGLVMDEYAKRIFPDMEPVDVYDGMMCEFFCR